jgi:hypothetical protein
MSEVNGEAVYVLDSEACGGKGITPPRCSSVVNVTSQPLNSWGRSIVPFEQWVDWVIGLGWNLRRKEKPLASVGIEPRFLGRLAHSLFIL